MLQLETLARKAVAAWGRAEFVDAMKALQSHLGEIDADRKRLAGVVEIARNDIVSDDDADMDADPIVVDADDGYWVATWIYINKERADALDTQSLGTV